MKPSRDVCWPAMALHSTVSAGAGLGPPGSAAATEGSCGVQSVVSSQHLLLIAAPALSDGDRISQHGAPGPGQSGGGQ